MNKIIKRYILVVLGILIVGCGASFTLKSGIGVGAWDALAKTLSDIAGIEVGTMGMLFNCLCVLGQIVILRKNFKWIQLMQIPVSILLGTVINFVFYKLLVFPFNSFIGGLIMFILASTFCAFGVALVMLVDEVTFALEGFCNSLITIIPVKFHIIRQAADVISVAFVVVLTLIFNLSWSLGVGTIIGMLTFGPTIGIFMKIFKPILMKYDLLKNEEY